MKKFFFKNLIKESNIIIIFYFLLKFLILYYIYILKNKKYKKIFLYKKYTLYIFLLFYIFIYFESKKFNLNQLPLFDFKNIILIFLIILNFLVNMNYLNYFIYLIINNYIILLIYIKNFFKFNFTNLINPLLKINIMKSHIFFMVSGYVFFFISSFTSILLLFNLKKLSFEKIYKIISNFIYNFFLIGFIFFTFGNVLGSIWAKKSWNYYWNWDSKEIWSLLIWIYNIFLLHFYHFSRLKIIFNVFNIINSILIIINLIFINFFYKNSLHLYK